MYLLHKLCRKRTAGRREEIAAAREGERKRAKTARNGARKEQ
jgi:hypothetical protein